MLPATIAALAAFFAPRLSFDRALEVDVFFAFDDVRDFLDLLAFDLTPAPLEDDLDLARLAAFFMILPPGALVRLAGMRLPHLSLHWQGTVAPCMGGHRDGPTRSHCRRAPLHVAR